MILGYIAIGIFAALMGVGAVCVVTHSGEKENICNYDYKENEK